ncbi:hypothetical protein RRG08_009262 [Elysia crispata]|uniref:Uncharacterized protein n=1 Tax=Elysia crispata TaxID=231223 RepID=A0AAE1E7L2_9GAST|nr:hypothetical protein RRG08_009262 [Elysia crispata]
MPSIFSGFSFPRPQRQQYDSKMGEVWFFDEDRPVQLGTPTVTCLLPDLPYNVSRIGLSSWVHRLSPVSCPIFLTMFLGSACPAEYTDCHLSPARSSLQCFWGRPVQLSTPTVTCLLPNLPYNVPGFGLSS